MSVKLRLQVAWHGFCIWWQVRDTGGQLLFEDKRRERALEWAQTEGQKVQGLTVVTADQIDAAAMEMLHVVREHGDSPSHGRAFMESVALDWGLAVREDDGE
jgi:hypothetical protein